jgi:lysophospholipase L1-like esterase
MLSAKFFCSSLLPMALLALNTLAGENADPAKPERPNEEWRMRHAERVVDVKSHADKLDVLFVGDSITGGWRDIGKEIWEKEFVPLHAVNIGIAGSQTKHLLWQFENGAIDGIHPRVVVLMIGVNHLLASPSHSTADIARGISTVVAKLREKLPHTKVLLLGTFPKDKSPVSPDRIKIRELNSLIAKLDDGKNVQYVDLAPKFLDAVGVLSPEISPDGVHLSPAGYAVWGEQLKPILNDELDKMPVHRSN